MSSSKRATKGRKRYLFSYGTLLPRYAPPDIAPTVRRCGEWAEDLCRASSTTWASIPGLF